MGYAISLLLIWITGLVDLQLGLHKPLHRLIANRRPLAARRTRLYSNCWLSNWFEGWYWCSRLFVHYGAR
jgi:hypothetical protein